jgi:aspartokinase-like uncharacterized kinase
MSASASRSWRWSPTQRASASRSSAGASAIRRWPTCSPSPSIPPRAAPAAGATAAAELTRRLLWVVKLGGSLADSPHLKRWLAVLSEAGGAAVIVPGGGPFADQVRAAQKRWRFDEAAAHHMALLAMEQYGRMLGALQAGLRPADSRTAIAGARRAGSAAIWMPTRMVLGEPRIAASWDITSDSLAAWLAGVLRADRLVLVKSVALAGGPTAASALARRGIVDPAFPTYVALCTGETWCVDDARHADMARALRTGEGPGTRVLALAGRNTKSAKQPHASKNRPVESMT